MGEAGQGDENVEIHYNLTKGSYKRGGNRSVKGESRRRMSIGDRGISSVRTRPYERTHSRRRRKERRCNINRVLNRRNF